MMAALASDRESNLAPEPTPNVAPSAVPGMAPDPATTTIVAAVPPHLREQFFAPDQVSALEELAARLPLGRDGQGLGRLEWTDGGADALERGGRLVVRPHATVLITAWGNPRLDAAHLDALPALRLVAHTGATVRPLVSPELFARGIALTQAGEGMARSVAEVALAFTLGLLHQVHRYDHALRGAALWEQAEAAPPRHEILHAPIGVIGASRTGTRYIRLTTALGGDVTVYDPYLTPDRAAELGVRTAPLDEILATSRIVAVHAPSLPQTHHMIGARELALMPDGAGLVNTARSWLVDEAALIAELASGRLDAALDVFDAEPLPVDHPLRALPNVLLTPHQAAGTVECRARQGRIVVDEIARLVAGQHLEHSIQQTDLERMA